MADRKALVKKHETIISNLTKDIKKKKGAYKTAAEQKLAEAQQVYDEELAAFDAGTSGSSASSSDVTESSPQEGEKKAEDSNKKEGGKPVKKETETAKKESSGEKGGKGGSAKTETKTEKPTAAVATGKGEKKSAEEETAVVDKKVKLDWDKRDLNGMSKKDLEEECVKLSLGKKGSKEDLITRLMTFALDNEKKESDDEEESDDSKENMTEEEKKEAERLYKREQAIQKALRVLLKKKTDGVLVSNVLEELSALGCKNFKPQLLNYPTMEKLLEDMPEYVLDYQEGPPAKIFPSGSLLDI